MITSENQDLVHVGSVDVKKHYIPSPSFSDLLKSSKESKSIFNVEFVNFPEEAKQAFLYVVSIWENTISSSVPINIIAYWENLDNMVLAQTRPAAFYNSFEGAPVKDVYYPVALVEKISGVETNISAPDVICKFNANMPWYYQTDGNTPETEYDFATVVLHEIAHGLGFFGFFTDDNGMGTINTENNIPSIYDYFIFNELEQQISNQTLFASPSEELHDQLVSGKLKFYNILDNDSEFDKTIDWIYAPRVCKAGVSIYHLNESSNNDCRLMGPYTYRGEAIHKIDEATLKVLSVMGWNSVSFDFKVLSDLVQPCDELEVDIAVDDMFSVETNRLQLIYSTNQFSTANAIEMHYNTLSQKFEAKIPLNYYTGNLEYFFKLNTPDNQTYFWPESAPDANFSLNIASDYFALEIQHNPLKMIYSSAKQLEVYAIVKGNSNAKTVKAEYKLDGILQKDLILLNDSGDYYSNQIFFEKELSASSKLEYRIIANYDSEMSSIVSIPASGYYSVNIFEPNQPVSSYYTDFDAGLEDFVLADFSVSEQQGFTSNSLNSCHPYYASSRQDEYYNHIAQLKYPVILNESGEMSFDEVVLVDPEETVMKSGGSSFSDFAIVEGSNDNGKTWQPITEKYNTEQEDIWNSYLKSLNPDNTLNYIQQGMFIKHSLSITENSSFIKGDTILIRFRLASNQSSTGWGWAIDNLGIQDEFTDADNLWVQKDVNVYPNPFDDQINIDLSAMQNKSNVSIHIFDLAGKTIYLDNNIPSVNRSIDLSRANPGIYMVTIIDESFIRQTKKIVKL